MAFYMTKEDFFAGEYEVQREKIEKLKEKIKSLEDDISELRKSAEIVETIRNLVGSPTI